jgi:hypothetical protein
MYVNEICTRRFGAGYVERRMVLEMLSITGRGQTRDRLRYE